MEIINTRKERQKRDLLVKTGGIIVGPVKCNCGESLFLPEEIQAGICKKCQEDDDLRKGKGRGEQAGVTSRLMMIPESVALNMLFNPITNAFSGVEDKLGGN